MARKHKAEEIVGKLREAELVLAQVGTVADACRRIGVTEQKRPAPELDSARREGELRRTSNV